jgi:hypothetical protein
VTKQSRQPFSSQSEVPIRALLRVPSPLSPRHETAPHSASMPLKRKAAAKGKRALRAPSIVDGFCQLPELPFSVGSVVPPACHLVLVAAPASPAARHGDGHNGSRPATTPDGPATGEIAVWWPRSGVRERPVLATWYIRSKNGEIKTVFRLFGHFSSNGCTK